MLVAQIDGRWSLMAVAGHAPDEVGRQLRAAEKTWWIGYPIAGKFAVKESKYTFLFGIPWTAFCVFWESMVIKSGVIFMELWGIPFLAVGFYLLTSPFWEYLRARRTIYVVSDQRLLILNGLMRPSTTSFSPSDIGPLEVDVSDDGSGSIIFAKERRSDGEGGWNIVRIGFKAIPNVREAEKHVVRLKEGK